MTLSSYKTLQHWKTCLYKILKFGLNTVVIDADGVYITVSVLRVNRVPSPAPEIGKVMANTTTDHAAANVDTRSSDQQQDMRQGFVIECVVRH